jgi:hypothetical protein
MNRLLTNQPITISQLPSPPHERQLQIYLLKTSAKKTAAEGLQAIVNLKNLIIFLGETSPSEQYIDNKVQSIKLQILPITITITMILKEDITVTLLFQLSPLPFGELLYHVLRH